MIDYFGEYKDKISLKYNLIANICHVGSKPEGGVYKIICGRIGKNYIGRIDNRQYTM